MPTTYDNQRKLHNPFLTPEYLERGGYGHIFKIPNTTIVVKIAHQIMNGNVKEDHRSDESARILQNEIAVYKAISTKPQHPNIVQHFLSNDVAIFLMYEPDSLAKRLERQLFEPLKPIPELMHFRWIKQLASVTTWLEQLDFFHGDLQPANILLDCVGHVKVCDFGRTTQRHLEIPAVTWPFYRPSKAGPIVAGPAIEQFSIGSCIYTIRNGHQPYGQPSNGDDYTKIYQALLRADYPSTANDPVLGTVVSACWNASYATMKEVEQAIIVAISAHTNIHDGEAKAIDFASYEMYTEQCKSFLKKEEELRCGKIWDRWQKNGKINL